MSDFSMSEKTNVGRLSGSSSSLGTGVFREIKGKSPESGAPRFSEVFLRIEDSHQARVSPSKTKVEDAVRDKKEESFEKEDVASPLTREDMVASQSQAVMDKTEERQGDAAADAPEDILKEEVQITDEAGASGLGQDKPVLSSGTKQDLVGVALTENQNLMGKMRENNLVSESEDLDLSSLSFEKGAPGERAEKSETPLSEKSEAGKAGATQASQVDLKTVLSEKLLAKQDPSAQRSVDQEILPADLKAGANLKTSTSILENTSGFAASQTLGSEGGAQGGMSQGQQGQGGTFLENSAFAQASNLKSIEASGAIQKTATDFNRLLEVGRTIPDERAVLRQVAQQLRAWRPGQDESIRFLLEPKNLGMIQIDLTLQEGGLRAHMLTADPAVKALLEGNQHFLQDALKDQGLKMQQFSVDVGDQKSFMHEERSAPFFKSARAFSEEGESISRVQHPASGLKPEWGGLSLYV